MKKIILIALLIISAIPVFSQNSTELPAGKVEIFDSFEHGNYWIWAGTDYDQYGYHKYSMGADITKDWATEGKHCLALRWEAVPKDTEWFDGIFFYDGNQDFTGTKYIVIDVYNPTPSTFGFILILQCTNSWSWKNCGSFELQPGKKQTLIFNISDLTLDEIQDVRRINIQMTSKNPLKVQSSVYIDNIRIIK